MKNVKNWNLENVALLCWWMWPASSHPQLYDLAGLSHRLFVY